MAETIVVGDEESSISPAEQSAHEAAVAEGATAVNAALATEAAAEAKAAAETALEAAAANIESGMAVEAAVEQANTAGASAAVSAEMVHEALLAQTSAINALTEELRSSRKASAPPAEVGRRSRPDREPGSGGVRLVRK